MNGSQFRRCGSNVRIYASAKILSPENIMFGSNIIIDDFVFIGSHRRLIIGNHVHIASHVSITGGGDVLISDFCGLSSGARLISGTDDFTGGALTGPTIPLEFRDIRRGKIILGAHAVVGANSVVLPDVIIGEGATIGAGSVVRRDLEPWGVYAGVPARQIKLRNREGVLDGERRLFEKYGCPEMQYRDSDSLEDW